MSCYMTETAMTENFKVVETSNCEKWFSMEKNPKSNNPKKPLSQQKDESQKYFKKPKTLCYLPEEMISDVI